jgi:hypothetical protein
VPVRTVVRSYGAHLRKQATEDEHLVDGCGGSVRFIIRLGAVRRVTGAVA